MDMTIRKATIDDADIIAQIVAMAIGDVETLENYCGKNYIEVLKEIARLKESQYSYNNAFIAEIDDIAVGAVIGYDGSLLNCLRKHTLSVINKYNPDFSINEDETQAGEYYLDSLGVLPEYRGLGIGKELVLALLDYAFKEHHSCVGLLVDYENPKAEKLYQSLGFERINTNLFLGHRMWHLQKKKLSK